MVVALCASNELACMPIALGIQNISVTVILLFKILLLFTNHVFVVLFVKQIYNIFCAYCIYPLNYLILYLYMYEQLCGVL